MKACRHFAWSFALLATSCVLLAAAGVASASIVIQTVPVGDLGNVADTTGYGSVGYAYSIGKYDVTLSQYTVFLNAVAATDTYGLYYSGMATDLPTSGISQSGSSGSYSYAVIGNGNYPVFDVSWGDAARFSNWLTNRQPSGAEGNGITETGSYKLNGATSSAALMSVTRKANANWVIPTQDEWYKAAYYKGGGTNSGYWLYPTQSNTQPSNALSTTGTNNANYYNSGFTDPTNYLTPVGYFAGSPSAYGTYDQGGDLWQWNEASGVSNRGVRGGSCGYEDGHLESTNLGLLAPTTNWAVEGFRVAQVPEPASLGLVAFSLSGTLLRPRCRHRQVARA